MPNIILEFHSKGPAFYGTFLSEHLYICNEAAEFLGIQPSSPFTIRARQVTAHYKPPDNALLVTLLKKREGWHAIGPEQFSPIEKGNPPFALIPPEDIARLLGFTPLVRNLFFEVTGINDSESLTS